MPRYKAKDLDKRAGQTTGLGGFLAGMRAQILDAATPERRAQMRQAERSHEIYRAWNAVCAGTREGKHVTGLRYLPESNELLVYLDAPSWTQEMTLLREIIRARMEREGAHVDGLVFKTTRPGYVPPADRGPLRPRVADRTPAPHADLTEAEDAAIDRAVDPIADARLREALGKAMKASAAWQKGADANKTP